MQQYAAFHLGLHCFQKYLLRGFPECKGLMFLLFPFSVPPTAPQDVSIISCTGNSAELIWEPGHDGGSKILSYLVQFNTSENPLHWNYYFEEIPGDVKSIHVNLPAWGTYSFRILAKNSVGYSGPSSPTKDHCTTPPEKPGGNPKDVRTLTYKKGKLIVTWTVSYIGHRFR